MHLLRSQKLVGNVFGREKEREKKECKMYLNYDTAKMPFYHWAKLIKTNEFGK